MHHKTIRRTTSFSKQAILHCASSNIRLKKFKRRTYFYVKLQVQYAQMLPT